MAVRLLELGVRTPLGVWTSICCECCVLSGKVLSVGVLPTVVCLSVIVNRR